MSIGFPYLKEKYISEILEVNGHFQWNLLLICIVIDCSAGVLVCGGGGAGGSENGKEDRGGEETSALLLHSRTSYQKYFFSQLVRLFKLLPSE